MFPKLIAPDGQVLQLGACTDKIRFADKYDFMQVMRWQAVTFYYESGLYWSEVWIGKVITPAVEFSLVKTF